MVPRTCDDDDDDDDGAGIAWSMCCGILFGYIELLLPFLFLFFKMLSSVLEEIVIA